LIIFGKTKRVFMKYIFKTLIITIIILSSIAKNEVNAQRIKTEGVKFVVGSKEIFMNGVNTPWHKWNDFGGEYEHEFWDKEFEKINKAGGNSSRIWISCDGEKGIIIDSTGYVSGATAAHWKDLEDMFELAKKHKIYIMATLLSFDHTKASHPNYMKWRKLLNDRKMIDSYVANYVVPFIYRFKDNPYLWSIDACNEIEWVNNDKDNALQPWEDLQYLVGSIAVATHSNSEILFTLGSAAVKWNCDLPEPFQGNKWSNSALQAQVNSPLAYLDFYSPHYYGWVVKHFGNFCTDMSPEDYKINDRPCMIGENPATGVFIKDENNQDILVVPMKDAYIKTFENGWKGLMTWTSNGVDRFGTLENSGPGLKAFAEKYPELTRP